MPRYAAKRDGNEREIIDELERNGCRVMQLNGRGHPDLLVYRVATGLLRLMEIKQPKGKLTAAQREKFPEWPAWVCRTKEKALAAMEIDTDSHNNVATANPVAIKGRRAG